MKNYLIYFKEILSTATNSIAPLATKFAEYQAKFEVFRSPTSSRD
jgi:hypothetical protein